jgi:hypothetical protein
MPGLLWDIGLVGRIKVSKAELKFWSPSFCRGNVCGLIKNGMGLCVGDYPGLLIGLVRVGFCEALALSSEQDQSDQPAHPWLFPKTACSQGRKRFSFNGLSGCRRAIHSLVFVCSC